jgi:hypothetical protein
VTYTATWTGAGYTFTDTSTIPTVAPPVIGGTVNNYYTTNTSISTSTGVNPVESSYSLYGHTVPLTVFGVGRIGGEIVSGPWIANGLASFIISFGVPADPSGTRTLREIAFDSEVVWESTNGFASESFTYRFYGGTLTQAADDLEALHFGGDAVAYRPQILIAFENLPLANTKFKKIPYVSAVIADATGDDVNLGEAFERLAYSPWVGYTSAQFDTTGITDGLVSGGLIIADQSDFLSLIQQFGRFYPKWNILQTDKLRIVDRGNDVTPDIVLGRDNLTGQVQLVRQEPNSVPGILELSTIDPDADYTIVPSRAQSPRSPVAVTSSVSTQSAYLPVIMDAATRIALVTYTKHHEDRARKQISLTTTIEGIQVEPGDIIGAVDLGDDFPGGESFRVLETLHGANLSVELTAESLLQCSVTALTTPPPVLPPFLGPYASFDGTPSNTTLSNSNRTATHSTTSDGGARSTSFLNSGKYFFSVTIGSSNGAYDSIGILPPTLSYATPGFGGIFYSVNSSTGAPGPISTNGTWSTYAIGLASAGDIVDVAVDFNLARIWFRRNGGFWNGWSDGDPVSVKRGIGPFNAGSLTWAPVVVFNSSSSGSNFTANFGASTFVYAPPTGFLAGWPI